MFERLRRRRWHRLNEQASTSPLNFDTDDRDSVRATMTSDELAKSMYEEARDKAKDLDVLAEVAVTLTKRVPVHHMEIMASLMKPGLTEQYGVQFTMQADNTFYFEKV